MKQSSKKINVRLDITFRGGYGAYCKSPSTPSIQIATINIKLYMSFWMFQSFLLARLIVHFNNNWRDWIVIGRQTPLWSPYSWFASIELPQNFLRLGVTMIRRKLQQRLRDKSGKQLHKQFSVGVTVEITIPIPREAKQTLVSAELCNHDRQA